MTDPRPEDVPADLYERALNALPGEPDDVISATTQDEIRHALAAVIPESQRQERRRIAAAIEDPSMWPDHFGAWTADQAEAARTMKGYILARLARGEAP
ncbi:hypothetical protein [Actinomadura luteofluorescens]|uniref:hypothetical protein n=1 Tax=Actinomadura luteofluorescens TaxID=46163 RepID=UPI003D8F506F